MALVDSTAPIPTQTQFPMGGVSTRSSAEVYTPAPIIDAARVLMGGIDLDPASCADANGTVRADTYYTKEDDGLSLPWYGRVWCNPPYGGGGLRLFAERLLTELEAGTVERAMFLGYWAGSNRWVSEMVGVADVHFALHNRLPWRGPSRGRNISSVGSLASLCLFAFNPLPGTIGRAVEAAGGCILRAFRAA